MTPASIAVANVAGRLDQVAGPGGVMAVDDIPAAPNSDVKGTDAHDEPTIKEGHCSS